MPPVTWRCRRAVGMATLAMVAQLQSRQRGHAAIDQQDAGGVLAVERAVGARPLHQALSMCTVLFSAIAPVTALANAMVSPLLALATASRKVQA